LIVGCSTPALVDDFFIPVQGMCFQCAENFINGMFDGARRVQVLDANQPLSPMMFSVEIAA